GPDVAGNASRRRHILEAAVILSIQPIRPAAKTDELVQLTVAVEVGPGVRLSARRGEELGLNQLELRAGVDGTRETDSDERDRSHQDAQHAVQSIAKRRA